MRCRWSIAALWLALAPALVAQEKEKPKLDEKPAAEKTAQEAFQAILGELRKTQAEDITAYRAAKTDAERDKALEGYIQKGTAVAGKVLELAKKNEKDPFAPNALVWIVTNTNGKEMDEAVAILVKSHPEQAGQAAQGLARAPFKHAEKAIRAILDKSTDRAAKGNATMALAQRLVENANHSEKDRAKLTNEAEKLFAEVAEKYADVRSGRGTLGEAAKSQLFELKHLSVGRTAPEIEGEDIDGKAFKLSDYRGKVVLLDFWGHW